MTNQPVIIQISIGTNSSRQPRALLACRELSYFHNTYPVRERAERVARIEMAKRGISQFEIRHV